MRSTEEYLGQSGDIGNPPTMSLCPKSLAFRGRRQGRQPLNMFLEHDRCEPPRDCRGVVSTAGWGSFIVQKPAKDHRKDEPGCDVHNEVYEHHHE